MSSTQPIVLAFSGGLDTSFCVPWLKDKGYEVTTAYVDTGGTSDDEKAYIEERAMSLGAVRHVTLERSQALWHQVVVPLVQSNEWYQGQYPLLCSDRYLIVEACVELAKDIGARSVAHGCTGMGNDQVRFDLSLSALCDLEIVAPIRELQKQVSQVRDYEIDYLKQLGFEVRDKSSQYSINENLLGVTISGGEIDEWLPPSDDVWQWTKPAQDWPNQQLQTQLQFDHGVPVALDGQELPGPAMLSKLNQALGRYGVGRGIYTGDTTIGLKGRIAFEAPGIVALCAAHRALEETTATRLQSQFKPLVANKWVELVYQGFFFEPLKKDLDAYLSASQASVSGVVTLTTSGGQVLASAVESDNILKASDAVYAQSASWTPEEAVGFVKLLGQSTELWTKKHRVGS
ncbi:MAG: argininosuccinate synthase [Pseudomonadota bacterium]